MTALRYGRLDGFPWVSVVEPVETLACRDPGLSGPWLAGLVISTGSITGTEPQSPVPNLNHRS